MARLRSGRGTGVAGAACTRGPSWAYEPRPQPSFFTTPKRFSVRSRAAA